MEELKREMIKQTGEVYRENLENLTIPTTKSVGNNLGKMIDGIFGWFGAWGETQKIKQEEYIKEFKIKLKEKLEKIPEKQIIEPKMKIVGPILETAKYYYDEEYYKEMFTEILSKACNKKYSNDIHPAFIETIKQISPLDAKIISAFKENSTYPIIELRANNIQGTVTPFNFILSDFKNIDDTFSVEEKLDLVTTIENLSRLGIIRKNREVIELGYDYEKFRENHLYKKLEDTIEKDSKMEIIKYRIELSSYGQNFFKICIEN